MAKLELLKGTEAINKSIKSVETKGKQLDALIHLTACSVLAHVHEFREVSLANKLLKAMPKSSRRNALIEWFTTYGEMAWLEADKELVFLKGAETQQTKAEADPFYDFKPEPPYHAIDLDKSLAQLLKNALKRQEEINEKRKTDPDYDPKDKIDAAKLQALQALVGA